MKKHPNKKVHATLLEKGTYSVRGDDRHYDIHYATFEFTDGTRCMFDDLKKNIYDILCEAESGMLSYKVRNRKNIFIGFDTNEAELCEQTSSSHRTMVAIQGKEKKSDMATIPLILFSFLLIFCLCLIFLCFPILDTSFLFMVIVPTFIISPFCLHATLLHKKLIAMPEQQMEAMVVGKAQLDFQLTIIFSFTNSNGMIKNIPVMSDVYGVLIEGDAGILTFKEGKYDSMFISFECAK